MGTSAADHMGVPGVKGEKDGEERILHATQRRRGRSDPVGHEEKFSMRYEGEKGDKEGIIPGAGRKGK